MTVQATLDAGTGRLELFLCIEGIGWPVDPLDLSQGFEGDVFATADQDGDLATQLSCTVHRGLRVTSAIGETLDPRSGEYSLGALSCSIVDHDGFLRANFNPHKENGSEAALSADLTYGDTEPYLDPGTDFATGAIAWVSDSEAILLGTKTSVSGTEYRYPNSTRAYAGTPRGRHTGIPAGSDGFAWPTNTVVRSFGRQRWRRNLELYAHVPGESSTNAVRLWTGKHATMRCDPAGSTWNLGGPGEILDAFNRKRRAQDMVCWSSSAIWNGGEEFRIVNAPAQYSGGIAIEVPPAGNPNEGNRRLLSFRTRGLTQRGEYPYALPLGYQYRTEPGGTYGMVSAWDGGSVQARDTDNDTDVLGEFIRIGGKNFLAIKRNKLTDGTAGNVRDIITENLSRTGGNDGSYTTQNVEQVELFESSITARFLLSNWLDDAELNRFTVNNVVRRNPVDILLCFMTTRDDEYLVTDSDGAGTASALGMSPGVGSDDFWAGAALHCVEGDNKGEARVISENTDDEITVEDAFSNAPGVEEYQIRNSIYDVLPFGWGLGVPYQKIDIDSFEELRDNYLPDAQVGRFYIGVESQVNIWDFLRVNILRPYGIHVYRDRTTGKLKAEYLGEAVGDGLIQSYTAITDADLLQPPGEIDHSLSAPVKTVVFNVRPVEEAVVAQFFDPEKKYAILFDPKTLSEVVTERIPSGMNGDTIALTVEQEEVGIPRYDGDLETIQFDAKLNTSETSNAALIVRGHHLIRSYGTPPPRVALKLSQAHVLTMRVNKFLLLTYDDAPLNPFSNDRGWSNVVARVVASKLMVSDGAAVGVEVECELLSALTGGKIAPAAKLDGAKSGSDGTSDYFVVAPTQFVSDKASNKDYYGFVVGDLIELRDPDGAKAGGPYTIRSFGANDASDPESASTDIIRITGSVPAAGGLTTSDYLTFSPWSASNTTNMDKHAAYSTGTTYTNGDATREYV